MLLPGSIGRARIDTSIMAPNLETFETPQLPSMLKSIPALGNRKDLLTGQYRLEKFYTKFQFPVIHFLKPELSLSNLEAGLFPALIRFKIPWDAVNVSP